MRLTIILLLGFLMSCNRIDFGGLETYTVKQGEHKSNFPLIQRGNEIYTQVLFSKSCMYDQQPTGMTGWNKLIGLMPGFNDIHKNSARWVWRYNHGSREIDLATYTYVNTERVIVHQISTPLEQWIELYVGYDKKLTKWVYGYKGADIGGFVRCPEFKDKNFWWLGLYFGGNSTAPHDITVHYKFDK